MSNICDHNRCKKSARKAAEHLCKELGVRFTTHRRRVFEIIWQSHKAMSAAQIMQQMDNSQPPITYRALDFLKNAGLIHHVTSLNAYVGCLHTQNPNHIGQLLICTSCYNIVELEPKTAIEKLTFEAKQHGFRPNQTHIEMLGTCKDCLKNERNA